MPLHRHNVTIYGKFDCCLCEQALAVLDRLQESLPFNLEKIDITGNTALLVEFGEYIPVIVVDGVHVFNYRVNENRLKELLR